VNLNPKLYIKDVISKSFFLNERCKKAVSEYYDKSVIQHAT